MSPLFKLLRGALVRTFRPKSRRWVVCNVWAHPNADLYTLEEFNGPRRLLVVRRVSVGGYRLLTPGLVILDDYGRWTGGNFFHHVIKLPNNSALDLV